MQVVNALGTTTFMEGIYVFIHRCLECMLYRMGWQQPYHSRSE
jgi:hypothetical protein